MTTDASARAPAARVLFVSLPLRGHCGQMITIARALAARGHEAGFVMPERARAWIAGGDVRFIPWPSTASHDADERFDTLPALWRQVSREPIAIRGEGAMFDGLLDLYPFLYESLRAVIAEHRPDLAVIDKAVIPAMDVARVASIPYVITSADLGHHAKAGLHLPQFGTSFPREMRPWQRVANRFVPLVWKYFNAAPKRRYHAIRSAQLGAASAHHPFGDHTVLIAGSMPGVEIERPLPPWIRHVGPILDERAADPDALADPLRAWLEDSADAGVVFMSFGTLAEITRREARALVRGLTRTGARILWSLPDAHRALADGAPASVRVEPFGPQPAVLAHPAVRAFVSHCGMNGVNESLHAGVPILAVPIFGDQPYNAARLVDAGTAIKLHRYALSAGRVHRAMTALLTAPRYADAARALSRAMRRTSGLERAIALIEDRLPARAPDPAATRPTPRTTDASADVPGAR